MSDGSEFQVRGAATKNARRARELHVLGTVSSGASDDRRGRTATAVWIRSLKYAGVAEDIVLNVSDAILYVTRCLTDSGATSEVVWRQFDLLAGRRLWLSCSEPAAVRRKSRPVHRIEHGVTVVQSGSDDTASHCLSQVVS